jgi:hypothetical protein
MVMDLNAAFSEYSVLANLSLVRRFFGFDVATHVAFYRMSWALG